MSELVQSERSEMRAMCRASEASTNVWQGPTPEHLLGSDSREPLGDEGFDLLIETNDLAKIPEPHVLANIERELKHKPQRLEFPSSGSVLAPSSDQQAELFNLVNTLRWIHYLANPDDFANDTDSDDDIDIITPTTKPCKILIHCPDGYTESSLLTLAYVIFAEGIPAREAWLKLHCERKRNFYAYPMDVSYLSNVQALLLQESPATRFVNFSSLSERSWFDSCDGSLPSRILPYMYLGSLMHANNPEMLHALGIHRVLSIGESVSWSEETYEQFGQENVMHITQVQDNGIDSLTKEFSRCLEFIRELSFIPAFTSRDTTLNIMIQNKESMTVQLHWYTAALVSPDQQRYVLLKLWNLWAFHFHVHSKSSLCCRASSR